MKTEETLREAFARFHKDNPDIWRHFERFTLMAIASGRTRYSADAICHRIRWHVNIETKSKDPFKVNDHHVAFYARMFLEAHPEHAGFFTLREQTSGAA